MPSAPFTVYGVVYDTDGTTLLENIEVFVLNKRTNETHSSFDSGFEDLKTNATGEWQVNLGSYTDGYLSEDIIIITAKNGLNTAYGRTIVVLTGGGIEIDITMETLDPIMNITKFLRAWIDDPNSDRNNTTSMIMPNYPRSRKLTKTSYPRISVLQDDEEAVATGIGDNQMEKVTATIKIGVHIWAKDGDAQKVTIGENSYEGTALRDYLSRTITDTLRQRFLIKPAYKKDPHIQDYYAYQRTGKEQLEFDEQFGILQEEITIQFFYIRQS